MNKQEETRLGGRRVDREGFNMFLRTAVFGGGGESRVDRRHPRPQYSVGIITSMKLENQMFFFTCLESLQISIHSLFQIIM